jgi:hypothetical protein
MVQMAQMANKEVKMKDSEMRFRIKHQNESIFHGAFCQWFFTITLAVRPMKSTDTVLYTRM